MEIKENNLKELIEKYMSIEETEENHEELHQLGHEIDHVIFDNNFYLVTHNDGEEKEIVSLIVGEDDEYFIPLYTDDEEVKEAIVRNKAVYFAAIGGAGALLSKCIKKAEVIAYDDLGTEAIRKLEVENLPAIVVIDNKKNNMYESHK